MLDALIIHPDTQRELYQGLADAKETALEPPAWARYLASYLERKNFGVEIIDMEALGLSAETVAATVKQENPRLVIIVLYGHNPSMSSQMVPATAGVCKTIKEFCDTPVLVVGAHAAALPEQTLRDIGCHFVCTGEGPITAACLLASFKANPEGPWLHNIPGLCFWLDEKPFRNPPAPNVSDLDGEMPGGQWEKLPMYLYRAHQWHADLGTLPRQPYASLMTSLNCPYSCSYCMIRAPFVEGDKLRSGGAETNYYRTWSGQTVIREIETLVEKYGVTNVRFNDEMFILNPGHMFDVCDRIIERGYGDKINVWVYGRIDVTKEKYLEKLRRAGVRWICLGVEAASNDVRLQVDKGQYTVEDIYAVCEKIKKADINILGNFLVGLPDDDFKTMEQTYQMALAIMPEYMNVYACMPFPGSTLYDGVKDTWNPGGGWKAYSYLGYWTHPLPTKHLMSAEVLKFRDDFFTRFYTNPSYLAHIAKKFGPQAVEMVKGMVNIPLRRKLLGD